MKILCEFKKLVPLSELKPHGKNRNKHSQEQITRLAQIFEYQGIRHPIIVSNLSGLVVAGHGRLEAAKKLGLTEFPVDYQDFKNEEQEYAFIVSDNSIALWSELDLAGINADIPDLGPDFEIDLLGIKNFHLDVAEKEGLTDPDDVPEAPAEPKTKLGDIYKLGNHRMMCGDSTSIDAVEKLMDGQRASITITSPPYNVSKRGFQEAKYNDGFESRTDEEYEQFLYDFTSICIEKSDYVFVNNQSLANNRFSLVEYQYKFKSFLKDILIWNKKICPPNICKGAFNTKWEYVFVFSKDNRTRGFPCEWQGQYPNVIETESNSGNEFASVHKAGYPIAFPVWIIEKMDFSKSVFDPFGGTGTTMIAAEKLNRTSYLMELDPKYCDVIISRWEKFTGQKAQLITEN